MPGGLRRLRRKSESCFVWSETPDDDIGLRRRSNETLMRGSQGEVGGDVSCLRAGNAQTAAKVEASEAVPCRLSNKVCGLITSKCFKA